MGVASFSVVLNDRADKEREGNGHREGNQCEETSLIEPGAVATELTVHITDLAAKQGAERLYAQLAITAADVADVIAFAVARPRRMTLNEILLRPTSQPG